MALVISASSVAANYYGKHSGYVSGELNGYQYGFDAGVLQYQSEGYIEWHNIEEVEWWLKDNDISQREYREEYYDCDNFAIDLAIAAAKEKRIIGIYRVKKENPHLMNFVIVGNSLYSIEPQTDNITFISNIDTPLVNIPIAPSPGLSPAQTNP